MTTITNWQEWGATHGANSSEGALEFPSFDLQLQALQAGSNAVAPLSSFAVLRVSGEDAETFLQGQLSADIRELNDKGSQYSTYSSAKGRMQASFLVWKDTEAFYLMLSADIAAAIAKRLTMFVLRSKVKIALDDGAGRLFALQGVELENWIAKRLALALPKQAHHVASSEGVLVIRLPSGALLCHDQTALLEDSPVSWQWVNPALWALKDIQAGRPWIVAATQEEVVAQMANMELIGAVSFKKGCFPGQEIVARTQYLGKLKRRCYRVKFEGSAPAGTSLYSSSMGNQAIGIVLNSAYLGSGFSEALAVVQSSCWESDVRLAGLDGALLEQLALPYLLVNED